MQLILRILKWTLLGILLAVLALVAWIGPQAYRALYPKHDHDQVAPAVPTSFPRPAILVFSKTNGFRHGDAIEAGNAMFRALAGQHGWSVYETENGAVFSADMLSRFQAVVWSNASGDVLTEQQRAALRSYLEQGGGFIGIHAAGDNSHEGWRWYVDELIGARFVGHTLWPHLQKGTVRIEGADHPAMAGVPAIWSHKDEWYSFNRSVRARGFRILATLDEASYDLDGPFSAKLRMGTDHPVIWSHCVGSGRALYSALGHTPESYSEPPFRLLIGNAVSWAMQRRPCDPVHGD
jgi:type 1 glutamine amidotransferase